MRITTAQAIRIRQGRSAKTGRPPLDIDWQIVETMSEMGFTVIEIATVLECSPDTLHRRFAAHIKRGKALLAAALRAAQFLRAMQGSTVMQIWLGKNILSQVGTKYRGG